MASAAAPSSTRQVPRLARVDVYRLLADAGRLQILALCAEEELAVGELSALLGESQPQVSRRAQPLRQAGLLEARREGTRTLLCTSDLSADAVLQDALREGRRLCHADGSLARIPGVVAAREERGLQLFEAAAQAPQAQPLESPELLSHLVPLSLLLPGRALAVDVGTGEGALLEVLGPLFERVIAVDRSRARLARCAERVAAKGLSNVSLFPGSYDDAALVERVEREGGADLVYASRTLHHASRPPQAVRAFARLLKRGGHLVLLDYAPHQDEALRQGQGDVWLGFAAEELSSLLTAAGLVVLGTLDIPAAFHRQAPDAHLAWQATVARRLPPPA